MRPQTEELLYFLLWTADTFMRPTWRNVNDSFENWAWRTGLSRRLGELAQQRLLERHPQPALARVVRLTEAGRQLAWGGRDPEKCWRRAWDGTWRMVLFDIPAGRDEVRQRLLRVLHRRHFGYLQKSVWISPDPLSDMGALLGEARVEPDAFVVMEGRPAAGESHPQIAAAAWDFPRINRGYERYVTATRRPVPGREHLVEWARRENALWKAAVRMDPLLPESLLPPDYKGREAFQHRQHLLTRLFEATGAAIPA